MTINGSTLDGVRPGKGFKDTLLAPLETKDYIYNESRLENGRRVLSTPVRYKSRSISLEFQIIGSTKAELETRKSALFNAFNNGTVDIVATEFSSQVFHFIYTGKTPTYSSGLSGLSCRVKVGFDEPNPSDRTAHS